MIDSAVGTVIAIALIPVLFLAVSEANASGITQFLLNLVPFVYTAVVIYGLTKKLGGK